MRVWFVGKYGMVYAGRVVNQPKDLAVKRISKSRIGKNDSRAILVVIWYWVIDILARSSYHV